MRLDTSRFGTLDYSEKEVITLKEGIVGLENHTRYLILKPPESQPFAWLQSLQDPAIALPVVQPQALLPDFQIELSDELKSELKAKKSDKLEAYCIVYSGPDLESSTINLLAPIVINTANKLAIQVLLEKKPYTSKDNLFDLLSAKRKSK